MEYSPFGSLILQRPCAPSEIAIGFELMYPGVGIFQQNDIPLQKKLGYLLRPLFICLDIPPNKSVEEFIIHNAR